MEGRELALGKMWLERAVLNRRLIEYNDLLIQKQLARMRSSERIHFPSVRS